MLKFNILHSIYVIIDHTYIHTHGCAYLTIEEAWYKDYRGDTKCNNTSIDDTDI